MAGEIIVNTPRETTMQDIAAALKSIAFSQAAKQENISDWAQLSGLSRNGYLKELFDFGDQINETWTDTAINQAYEFPWQITHFDTAELEDGETLQGTFLEAHYTVPFGVQFSNRAFLRCPDGLAAGTYNVSHL